MHRTRHHGVLVATATSLVLLLALASSSCAGTQAPSPTAEPVAVEATSAVAEATIAVVEVTVEAPAAASPAPCLTEYVTATDPSILATLPVWSHAWFDFVDPPGDFLLDHPLYAENFDAAGVFDEVAIPDALDITSVRLGPEGEYYLFEISTARGETGDGETLRDLLTPGRRVARFGLYFDVDRNGVSEYLLTTNDESADRAVILPATLDEPLAWVDLTIGEDTISLFVPRSITGESFDWIAFTGFSPVDGAFFTTPLDWVFFNPVIDVYNPQDLPLNRGFSTSYTGTGVQCQVTDSVYNSCPAKGTPPPVPIPVPGTTHTGVQLYRVRCDGRGYAFWCINQSFFGKEVLDANQQLGWVARCPYSCGFNVEDRWDVGGDGLVDKIFHTITDQDCYDHTPLFTASASFKTDLDEGNLANIIQQFAAHQITLTNSTAHPLKVATVCCPAHPTRGSILWLIQDSASNTGYVAFRTSQGITIYKSVKQHVAGDTLRVMEHTYVYPPTNQLTSCQKTRAFDLVSTVLTTTCLPAQQPYANPSNVPGAVP